MHLPQIVADLKYRRKIAEEVFSPELLGVRSISEFCGEKDDITFSADPT
jgi:hypothetical protein